MKHGGKKRRGRTWLLALRTASEHHASGGKKAESVMGLSMRPNQGGKLKQPPSSKRIAQGMGGGGTASHRHHGGKEKDTQGRRDLAKPKGEDLCEEKNKTAETKQ